MSQVPRTSCGRERGIGIVPDHARRAGQRENFLHRTPLAGIDDRHVVRCAQGTPAGLGVAIRPVICPA